MPAGFSPLLATAIAVILGASATAWLRLVRQRREETLAGLRALTDMRSREFSRLVVEALQTRGYEYDGADKGTDKGAQGELRMRRDGRTWLLACRQCDVDSYTPRATIKSLADAVRYQAAGGGILATPGRVDLETRKAATGIELHDGESLWQLVGPTLPPSLREDLSAHARKRNLRETALACGGALLLGMLVGVVPMLLPDADAPGTTVATPVAAAAAKPSPEAARAVEPHLNTAAPADPNREQFERAEVIRAVGALPWVERVMWSTASTLWVHQRETVAEQQVQDVCGILSGYDALRASRLQLQPAPGSQEKVRFLQCRAY